MTSPIEQLSQLMALRSPTLELQPMVDALAQSTAATGVRDITEALSELSSMGIDPSMYIPVSRSHARMAREKSRLKQEELNAAQERQHRQEIHDLEIQARRTQLAALTTVTP